MVDRVLVCWDGSEQSRYALKYAIDKVEGRGLQKITAIFVREEESARIEDMLKDYEMGLSEELLKTKNSIEEALVTEAQSLGEEKGVEVDTRVIEQVDEPAVDIVEFAEKNDFDHIIVGSHGRTGISRLALGSVAEEIVKNFDCIVTVVRCKWPPNS